MTLRGWLRATLRLAKKYGVLTPKNRDEIIRDASKLYREARIQSGALNKPLTSYVRNLHKEWVLALRAIAFWVEKHGIEKIMTVQKLQGSKYIRNSLELPAVKLSNDAFCYAVMIGLLKRPDPNKKTEYLATKALLHFVQGRLKISSEFVTMPMANKTGAIGISKNLVSFSDLENRSATKGSHWSLKKADKFIPIPKGGAMKYWQTHS